MEDFQELYRLYARELFYYLYRLSNNRTLAEELVQETFYQAYISIHRFKGNSTVRTWLYQIAKNVYAKDRRSNKETYVGYENLNKAKEVASSAELMAERKEFNQSIHQAVFRLKDPYREVIILRSFQDLNFRDIGASMQKSENWARVTFYRAKKMLREILEGGI
ncbi:RNA polymerase sigma factor [Radiobacillus kanasensis]|uniref:RNA polymerase sigma factor n=1 Tax=Radiobacillus kanasensis TaxID=2844358 RepID=UPI001E408A2A|nr:RNA polymerase sigma factor [Radiobacillus kanasensis]UFT98338.1 RNA polymerase sigma factor [Radiobacillus kanasensis]